MSTAACLALLFLSSLPSCLCAPTQLSDGTLPELVQLTSSNWSSSISQGSWLIEFYSPYCTPCKAFLPLWAELVKNKAVLASDIPAAPFRLAQVNCHAEGDLCVQQGVPHFPRLSFYKDGKMTQGEYQGNREYTELAAWIDEEVKDYRQSKGSQGVSGGQNVLQGPAAVVAAPQPPQPVVSQPYPIAPGPATDSAKLLAATTAQDVLQPQASPPLQQQAAAPEQQQVAPPPPPPPPPPPAPASPPPPPPVDLSLPNPYGKLLKFGSSPGLATLQDLRDWLGVSAEDTQPLPPKRKGGRPQRQTIPSDPKRITSANANEGHLGTGATDAAKGYGGAHLSNAAAPMAAPPTDLPGNRKLTPAKGGTFVKFFAPWCPHCRAMAQAFEKLAEPLRNKLNILEVDCEAHHDVCRAFHVNSYPTLRLYSPVNELVSEYRGSRTFDGMFGWCEKAAQEEVVDLVEVKDGRQWRDDIARTQDVRFLWVVEREGPQNGEAPAALEEERRLVTLASRTLFTSPYRVYRSTSGELIDTFQSKLSPWKGSQTSGGRYRSALLAFKDHSTVAPVSSYSIPASFNATSQRTHLSQWLDWSRYPTVSQVGGDAWVDVMNNVHSAPVVLALVSGEQHEGQTFATGSGEVWRRGELAALKRMALAWRDSGLVFNRSNSGIDSNAPRYTSSGGLLWAWIDADRHRSALKKYYKLSAPLQDRLPALLLVDTAEMSYWELPTLSPSRLVDISVLDPPPAGSQPPAGMMSKTTYFGESREVSTWLGEGAASNKTDQAASLKSLPSFADDLGLLPFIASISRGEQSRARRSTRSRFDRGTDAMVRFASSHWILSLLVLAGLVAGLARYVRAAQDGGRNRVGRGYRTLIGRKKD